MRSDRSLTILQKDFEPPKGRVLMWVMHEKKSVTKWKQNGAGNVE